MRLPSALLPIMLSSLLVLVSSCGKESFSPASAGDPEATLSSNGQGPQVATVDSSNLIIDGPGEIDIVGPDSTGDQETPPPFIAAPETILSTLSEAYRTRDLALFATCLAPDFRFYPAYYAPGTIPGPDEEFWGKEREIAVHQNMFNSNYKSREPFRGAEFMSVSFAVLQKESYGDPSRNRWRLTCHALWRLSNTQMTPKPFGITHEGNASFVIAADPEDPDRWLIETWRERIGQTRFIYQP